MSFTVIGLECKVLYKVFIHSMFKRSIDVYLKAQFKIVSKNDDKNVSDASPVAGGRSGISGMQFRSHECISAALKDPDTVNVLYGLQFRIKHIRNV